MTQVLQTEDSALPQGLTIQNAYTELPKGSKYIVMVVRSSTVYPKVLWPVARNTTRDQGVRGEDGPSSTQFDYYTEGR